MLETKSSCSFDRGLKWLLIEWNISQLQLSIKWGKKCMEHNLLYININFILFDERIKIKTEHKHQI